MDKLMDTSGVDVVPEHASTAGASDAGQPESASTCGTSGEPGSTLEAPTPLSAFERAARAAGRWWVLHTRSRNEKRIAETLDMHGVAYFLPLHGIRRRYAKSCATFQVPLFPGYVFLRGDGGACDVAWKTNRVASILRVEDQRHLEIELAHIDCALRGGDTLQLFPAVRIGRRYRITRGALSGVEGVVVRHGRSCRMYLSVTMLGQSAMLEVDASLLEPAD